MAAWRYEISLLMLKKYFTHSLRSCNREIFFNARREILYISARPCNSGALAREARLRSIMGK